MLEAQAAPSTQTMPTQVEGRPNKYLQICLAGTWSGAPVIAVSHGQFAAGADTPSLANTQEQSTQQQNTPEVAPKQGKGKGTGTGSGLPQAASVESVPSSNSWPDAQRLDFSQQKTPKPTRPEPPTPERSLTANKKAPAPAVPGETQTQGEANDSDYWKTLVCCISTVCACCCSVAERPSSHCKDVPTLQGHRQGGHEVLRSSFSHVSRPTRKSELISVCLSLKPGVGVI